MLPALELLGLVKVWLMVEPELAEAPVIAPVLVPSVQAKLEAAEAVKAMAGLVPLQVLAVVEVVTTGVGFTVTVIFVAEPTQEPTVEVGVTAYTMLPEVELLGLVKVWLMVEPELAEAPVIAPVFVPKVHANVLDTLAVRLILGLAPLQALAVAAVVTLGIGFTVKVAAVLVVEGVQVPLTTHSYMSPFTVVVAPVRLRVEVVTFV